MLPASVYNSSGTLSTRPNPCICSSLRDTGVGCHFFSRGPCFIRTLHYDLSVFSGPGTAWLVASLSYIHPFTTRLWSVKEELVENEKNNLFLLWKSGSESVGCSAVSNGLYLSPWNSPGQNTGVGSHFLLQGILLTQGSNLGFKHCRQNLCCLSHHWPDLQGCWAGIPGKTYRSLSSWEWSSAYYSMSVHVFSFSIESCCYSRQRAVLLELVCLLLLTFFVSLCTSWGYFIVKINTFQKKLWNHSLYSWKSV